MLSVDRNFALMDAVKEQGNVYSKYTKKEQIHYGIDLIKPYLKSGFHVLDVGCGTGNLSLRALDIVGDNGSLLGIDSDQDRIKLAKEMTKDRPNASFMCLKGSDMALDKRDIFDAAFSNVVFHWMEEKEKWATVNNVWHLLKPGGLFLIQYIDPKPPIPLQMASFLGKEYREKADSIWHEKTLEDFATMCKETGFKVLHSESIENEVIWETLGELLVFFTASVNGVIDFRKVKDKLAEEGKEIPSLWMKNGAFFHIIQLRKLVVQRPEQ